MAQKPSHLLIDTIRATLKKVEQTSDLSPDDPALSELKRILLARIAELQVAEFKAHDEAAEGDHPTAAETGAMVSLDPALDPALTPPVAPAEILPLIADEASESPMSAADAAPRLEAPEPE